MHARKRTTLAVRLFDLHPIYRGIEAGAFAHFQVALSMALDPQTRETQRATIQRMFHDCSELLGWIRRPLGDRERNEVVLSLIEKVLSNLTMSPEQKVTFIELSTKRPRGRPSDSKHLAVYALEVKAVRPVTKWEKVTELLCPCTKPGHDSCCVENLKSQVKRLRLLLCNTGLVPLIVATAVHRTLKLKLQALLA